MPQILPSTILGFVSKRLYSDKEATQEFGPLIKAFSGESPLTWDIQEYRNRYWQAVLDQCPPNLQTEIKTWEHSADWREYCAELNEKFGLIEINQVQPAI